MFKAMNYYQTADIIFSQFVGTIIDFQDEALVSRSLKMLNEAAHGAIQQEITLFCLQAA